MRIVTIECFTKEDLPSVYAISALKDNGDQVIVKVHSACYSQHYFTDKGINYNYSIDCGYHVDKIIYVDNSGRETVLKDRQEEKKQRWILSTKTLETIDQFWYSDYNHLLEDIKMKFLNEQFLVRVKWLTDSEWDKWRKDAFIDRNFNEVSHKGF